MSTASVECRDLTHAYTRGWPDARFAGSSRSHYSEVRFQGVDGAVRFREDDAAEPDRRSGPTGVGGGSSPLGTALGTLSSTALAEWRARHVRFVFSVLQPVAGAVRRRNVELPLLRTSLTRSRRRQHADTALRIVGIEERAATSRRPSRAASNSGSRLLAQSSPT